MENTLALFVLTAVGWWIYKCGKRIGSRKGYNAGRAKAHRRRHPQ